MKRIRRANTRPQITEQDGKYYLKPPRWNNDRCRQVWELALLGATNEEMSSVMGVNIGTFEYWQRTKPEFKQAVQDGKLIADGKVARGLYESATGYSHKDTVFFKGTRKDLDGAGNVISETTEIISVPTTKYYPPNATAASKWLAARHPDMWADRLEVQQNSNVNLNVNSNPELVDFSMDELMALEKLGMKKLVSDAASRN